MFKMAALFFFTFCVYQRILAYFIRGSIAVGAADLLFYLFGLNYFAYVELTTDLTVKQEFRPYSDTSPYKESHQQNR